MKGVEKKRQDIKISDVSVWPHNYKWSTTAAISCASMTPSHLKEKELYTKEKEVYKLITSVHSLPLSHTHDMFVLKTSKLVWLSMLPQALDYVSGVEISIWCSPCM